MTQEVWLVTGARGMLGSAVVADLEAQGERVAGTDLPDVDLSIEAQARALVERVHPARVIHCAAWTDVNGAEGNPDACHAANATATAHLAAACARIGARLLMVSTDFVFDGEAREPYREDAAPRPLSAYGRSKLEAERALAAALADHQIARTAWLYGPGRRNFVAEIYRRLARRQPVRVVADQIGSPTYTLDLSPALISLARAAERGVFHLANSGQCSRYEMAREIARLGGFDPDAVEPIRTADWPSPARRPAWSVLDCSRAAALGIGPLRDWTRALSDYVAILRSEGEART